MKHLPILQEYCLYATYLAPKGKERLSFLGEQIAQRHLTFHDRLIGIVGGAGSGKSSLIKGMFPGLELSNDDDGVNPRKILQVNDLNETIYNATTFHIDMRFQTAFSQMAEIVDFVRTALEKNRRVIIEHFDILYPALNINADIIVGIGDEILFVRPTVFGPMPKNVLEIVESSLKIRKEAHTAEHLAIAVLTKEMGIKRESFYSADIQGGFVLRFETKPAIDLAKLEARVKEEIAANHPVCYFDEGHIKVGQEVLKCNGSRIHVRGTGEIGDVTIVKNFIEDAKTNTFCLVGLLGRNEDDVCGLTTRLNIRL